MKDRTSDSYAPGILAWLTQDDPELEAFGAFAPTSRRAYLCQQLAISAHEACREDSECLFNLLMAEGWAPLNSRSAEDLAEAADDDSIDPEDIEEAYQRWLEEQR